MRVLLDANIFISYLLTPLGNTAINLLVESAFTEAYTLLTADRILQEFANKVSSKKYLAQRIAPGDVVKLVNTILEIAEIIPEILDEIPAVGRDRKDDYLLAYALVADADYLVTGDSDLLILGEVEGVKIVRPRDFVNLLQ